MKGFKQGFLLLDGNLRKGCNTEEIGGIQLAKGFLKEATLQQFYR